MEHSKVRDDDKVSICIPSYNHAKFLPAAIDSALGQTYRNVEIVIADDGSTDDSLAIAQGYEKRNPTIVRVVAHPGHRNLGISATENLAFRESRGAYWSVLASDDLFLPRKTERQMKLLQSHGSRAAWVYGVAQYVDAEGNELPGRFGNPLPEGRAGVEMQISANRVPAMTVLARRQCISDTGGYRPGLLYSDWELWVRVAARYVCGFVSAPVVSYRMHGNNTSIGIAGIDNAARALEVMDSLKANAKGYGGDLDTPRTHALVELQRTRYLFALTRIEDAKQSLSAAFRHYPALARNPKLFYDWMTSGYIAHFHGRDFFEWVVAHLLDETPPSFSQRVQKSFNALALARAAARSYADGDLSRARALGVRAQATDARWLRDRELLSVMLKSALGSRMLNTARALKQRASATRRRAS